MFKTEFLNCEAGGVLFKGEIYDTMDFSCVKFPGNRIRYIDTIEELYDISHKEAEIKKAAMGKK